MSTTMSEEPTSTGQSGLDEDTPVDLNLLRELGKSSLVNVLNSVCTSRVLYPRSFVTHEVQVNGVKTLVLDPSIAGPLGLLTEVSLLKVSVDSVLNGNNTYG